MCLVRQNFYIHKITFQHVINTLGYRIHQQYLQLNQTGKHMRRLIFDEFQS